MLPQERQVIRGAAASAAFALGRWAHLNFDGVDDRVAIAYTTGTYSAGRVAVRVSSNGSSFGSEQKVFTYGDSVGGNRIGRSYGPAPQPFGSNGLLVVYPGCRIVGGLTNPCNCNKSTMRSDLLLWQKVGATSTGPQVVQAAISRQTINDSASLVVGGNKRYILFNGWPATPCTEPSCGWEPVPDHAVRSDGGAARERRPSFVPRFLLG